jgi:ubiquinone/menaquinone biosynthesis C-methylase UbiE
MHGIWSARVTPPAPRLDWDYTSVARAYLKRPGYAGDAIDEIVRHAGLAPGMRVADVGAGTGNLTLPLLERGLEVVAIEPNDAMRRLGLERTGQHGRIAWRSAFAEATTLPDGSVDAVGFGSSFNVVDAERAVVESARIVRPGGSVFCLWNHRQLVDPLQAAIEAVIHEHVPAFAYGTRRADPSPSLLRGAWFGRLVTIEAPVVHAVPRDDFVEAWRSHLTLRRQAGTAFPEVIAAIERLLGCRPAAVVRVPYVTRAWLAIRRAR